MRPFLCVCLNRSLLNYWCYSAPVRTEPGFTLTIIQTYIEITFLIVAILCASFWMAMINLPRRMSLLTSESSRASDHLSSASICSDVYSEFSVRRRCVWKKRLCIRSMKTTENQRADVAASQNGPLNTVS